jgi:hypothetical protein
MIFVRITFERAFFECRVLSLVSELAYHLCICINKGVKPLNLTLPIDGGSPIGHPFSKQRGLSGHDLDLIFYERRVHSSRWRPLKYATYSIELEYLHRSTSNDFVFIGLFTLFCSCLARARKLRKFLLASNATHYSSGHLAVDQRNIDPASSIPFPNLIGEVPQKDRDMM